MGSPKDEDEDKMEIEMGTKEEFSKAGIKGSGARHEPLTSTGDFD